jgi:regulatory protein
VEPRQPKKNRPEPSLRARALRLLARREHSRLELQRKLAPHAPDPEELENLIGDLVRRGWLSEQRVVEQLVHARRGKHGSQRIRQELLDKGIAEELVAQALPQLRDGDADAARALWQRKFGTLPRNMAERAKQVRFMQSRGFALETVLRVIKQGGEDE